MIWIILFVSLVLRIINLNQSLWLDEAINVIAVKSNTLLGVVTQYSIADFHPPGWFIILWIWGKVFGYSEISVRLPSVLFAILTIYVVYLIGRKILNVNLGLIAALLISINPLHIYYSQEARMYSMSAFAVTLNMYLFIKLIKGDRGGNIFYILSNILILMSDYVAYFIFPAQLIILFFLKNRKLIKHWLVVTVLSILLISWWFPFFLNQLKVGSNTAVNVPGWNAVVGAFGIKPLLLTYIKFIIGRIGFSSQLIYALIFIPIGLFFLYLIWCGFKYCEKKYRGFLMLWLAIPITFALLVSLLIPVYSYFRVIFVLPSFLIFVALGILSSRPKLRIFFLSLVILIEMIFSITYLFNSNFHREDWRELVSFLKSKSDNSKILFESTGSFSPFDYYSNNSLKGIGGLKNFPAKSTKDLIDLQNILDKSKDVYLINYLVEISDPDRLVSKKLIELKYKQYEIINFRGVGFIYHYIKE